VYRANVTAGALGAFATATLPDGGAPVVLQTSRYDHAIIQAGSYVYAIGGWSGPASGVGGTDLTSIERAQVDPVTGDFVTNFAAAIDPATSQPATLAMPRLGAQVYQDARSVYIMGGQTGVGGASTLHDEIQQATLDANGNLSSFTQVGLLPSALAGAGVLVAGGTVYLVGGAVGYSNPDYILTGTVYAAQIAADGSLGTFTVSPQTLPYAQCCGGSAAIGNTLYLFEGLTGNGFTATTSVETFGAP
jgi:hypothetical protein